MAKKVKLSLNFPLELKLWLEEEGDRNGLNLTTMIQLACMNYRKEQEALRMGAQVDIINAYLEQMKEQIRNTVND